MLHGLMLLGLVGLSVPVILHLIQRQRLRPQILATMHFLEPEDAANAFAPVPRDLLQLLLRLVLLTLFIFLMARLVIGGNKPGPRTMAVVLDQSMSMQRRASATQSLFERHKQQILEMIDGMGPDDRLALMLVGDQVTVETGFLKDRQELREIAERFEVSDSGGLALLPAIRSAARKLASRHEVNACVLVFSDHQRSNYQAGLDEISREGSQNVSAAFQREIEGGRVKLMLIDENLEEGTNLAVEEARFDPERVYVGSGARLTTVVRNHSDRQQSTTVRMFEGEQAGAQRPLTLEPGEAAHIDLVHRFESPLDSACRVEIEDDSLPGDNRYHLPMRIHDRKQILLVAPPGERDGEERGLEASHRATDLLAYALNPGEALGKGAGTSINVKRLTPQRLTQVSLPIYSIIILQGVIDLPEQSIKDLSAFVKNGGGIWLIPGPNVSPLRFNETYARLLNGFAIGQLKQPDPMPSIDKSEARIGHPLFLPLMREEWGNTRDIYFKQYYTVQARGTALTPLAAAGGDWLAAVIPHERGRVFVQLFDGSLDSTSLPRSTAFVSVVQQTASFLGRHDERRRPDSMRVGEVMRVDLPEFRNLKGEVKVAGPSERLFPLTGADAEEIRVEGLLRAGPYAISHEHKQTGRRRWLTVNPVLGESDLTPLDEEGQASLFGVRNVVRIPAADLSGQFAQRHEVTELMAVLLLLAFAVEAVVGAWQSRRKPRVREKEVAA
jgi:hypothetical protein